MKKYEAPTVSVYGNLKDVTRGGAPLNKSHLST